MFTLDDTQTPEGPCTVPQAERFYYFVTVSRLKLVVFDTPAYTTPQVTNKAS